ncbi:MAG: hypothetical protein Q7R70_06560 [Candidatus Diapherotrites archaeon]|nr:hypothetical protein [Candidatus Diapherotrites archaeon]
MVEMFRIGSGPWEKLFEGSFQKFQVQLYSNPESIIMVAIFDVENGQVKGLISEFYKIYLASGSVETFSETLPRELLVLTKHDSKRTLKFLAVGSGTSYADWKEDSVMLDTDSLLLKLKTSSEMIKDVSKAYDLKLTELKETPADIKEEFFTYPLLLPSLATNYHSGASSSMSSSAQATMQENAGTRIVAGEVTLGVTREGQAVEEPLSLLLRSAIFDGTETNRNHTMQVLIEGALLSNVPSVIFDWNENFEGIGFASTEKQKLKEFKLEIEPIGFPARKFNPCTEVQANVSAISPEGLLELFGINSSLPPGKIIILTMSQANAGSMQEISEAVKKMEFSTEITAYQKMKAIRTLNLIQLRYPKFFDGKNNMEEISKNWVRAIGRASIISIAGLDMRQAMLLIEAIVKEMLLFYKEKGTSKQPKSMIFIPEIQKLSQFYKTGSFKSLANSLKELKDYGVGFAVSVTREIDLDDELMKNIESEFGIIMQNDVGMKLSNRKQYRVLFRPTISEFRTGK